MLKQYYAHYRKAVWAGGTALVLGLISAYVFPPTQWTITQGELQAIAAATLGAIGAPAAVKANAPKPVKRKKAAK